MHCSSPTERIAFVISALAHRTEPRRSTASDLFSVDFKGVAILHVELRTNMLVNMTMKGPQSPASMKVEERRGSHRVRTVIVLYFLTIEEKSDGLLILSLALAEGIHEFL